MKYFITLALCFALSLFLGCAFTGGGWGVDLSWTIGDASVGCDFDETGYASGGADCIQSGAESISIVAGAAAEASDAEDEETE